MADDITISGSGDTAQPGQTGGQSAGSQPTGNQTQTQNPGDQLNPIINLSGADQNPAPGSTGAPAPAQTAPQGRRSKAIMLGEEEEGVQPPPSQEKYAIPALVKEKFPDLIQLIKETESMNDEERDYWFQILPIMTEEQIRKFRDILVNEKQQLTNLDQEYEQELQKLNDKHMIEWKEFETKEKRKTLTSAEQTSKAQEKAEEEELLKRLSQV